MFKELKEAVWKNCFRVSKNQSRLKVNKGQKKKKSDKSILSKNLFLFAPLNNFLHLHPKFCLSNFKKKMQSDSKDSQLSIINSKTKKSLFLLLNA